MCAPTPVTHVIFDMDGILLDSEVIYNKILQTVCDRAGKEFTWECKAKLMGKNDIEAAKIFVEELELPLSWEEYYMEMAVLAESLLPDVKLMAGADKLVRHLHKHNIPIAVASSSSGESLKLKTAHYQDLFSFFHHIVLSGDDPEVKNGKPAPDCFLVAAERFPGKAAPNKCLVFEDAPDGAESGLAAGMQVVWIPDSRIDKTVNKLDKRVAQILTSLEEFKPEDFGLPAFDSKVDNTENENMSHRQGRIQGECNGGMYLPNHRSKKRKNTEKDGNKAKENKA